MIKIEKTLIIDRFNIIDESKKNSDDDKFIRQISLEELKYLLKSVIDLMEIR